MRIDRKTILVVLGIAAIAVAIIVWPRATSSDPQNQAAPVTAPTEDTSEQVAGSSPSLVPEDSVEALPVPKANALSTTATGTPAAKTNPLAMPPPANNPRAAVDEVLVAENMTETEKWQRLLHLLPTLPESLQEETAQHVCNLVSDEAYGALGPLLTNNVAPEPVLDVVMTDLLSRPNNLKLPILLQMARNEQNPRWEEARSILELYLEQDFGADWTAWEKSLHQWLKDNPE